MISAESPALYDDDPPAGVPVLDLDPFTVEYFGDPYPHQALLRDAGPFVWLSRYRLGAVARYAEVRGVLTDWQTYASGRGVGMADFVRHGRFRLPSLILEADPPQHTRSRTVLARALSAVVMRGLRERFAAAAERMVDELLAQAEFDAIAGLAQAYPLRVFPDAIGMKREGRDNLLPFGDLVFNSFGPDNALFRAAAENARSSFAWVEEQSLRRNLAADGFGMIVYAAADAGEITEDEAAKLVRSMLTAGVDTTVNGLGAAIFCLARFPGEWERLHRNPALARSAFEEAVRFESPVQTFFRTTTRAVDLAGASLREGQKVLMFLGAANRDPRQWPEPDRYDIERKSVGHVGFGFGIHACVGQLLARLEGELVLAALARRVARIEMTGPPQRHWNNTLRGLKSLPVRLHAA